jgi:hypothetical protein
MKTHTTSGIQVTEYDEADTLDLEIEAPALDVLADRWEALASVYAAGDQCPACMWHDSGVSPNGTHWRECSAFAPDACPGVNPKSIANALRRQAS